VTFGSSLESAYMKMETVEHFAKIALVTHLLGNEQPLGEKEVQKLNEVRHRYNGGTSTPPRRQAPAADLQPHDLQPHDLQSHDLQSHDLQSDDVESTDESKQTAGSRR
jgi:hypothetical protein